MLELGATALLACGADRATAGLRLYPRSRLLEPLLTDVGVFRQHSTVGALVFSRMKILA